MKSRLQKIYHLLGFQSAATFASSLGVHPTYISQIYTNGLNSSFEKKLKTKFPRINLEYLRTGEGDPLLPEPLPDEADIQRAGQVQLVVDILEKLDGPTLDIILEAIEKFRQSPHFREPDEPVKKN